MATQSSKWATTFFWEQDLRSLYMNGLLNSLLKPGIYNADMFVFATDGGGAENITNYSWVPKEAGVYLYLKRGTTFIFSNNYSLADFSGKSYLIQDMEHTGNFLIKSVVLEDTAVKIERAYGTAMAGGVPDDMRAFFGNPNTGSTWGPPGEIFITAQINFNGDGALGTLGADSIPTFSWALKKGPDFDNYEYGTSSLDNPGPYNSFGTRLNVSKENSSKEWIKNFWFVDASTFRYGNTGHNHYFIPEGEMDNATTGQCGPIVARVNKNLERFNYLIIGRLLRKAGSTNKYITTQGAWDTTTESKPGYYQWMEDYAFTGAGLPTYRQELTGTNQTFRPSILPVFDHNSNGSAGPIDAAGAVKTTPYKFDLKNLIVGNRKVSAPSTDYLEAIWNRAGVDLTSAMSLKDWSEDTTVSTASNKLLLDFFYLLLADGRERTEEKASSTSTSYLITAENWQNLLLDKAQAPLKTAIKRYSYAWTGAQASEVPGLSTFASLDPYEQFCSLDLPTTSADGLQANPSYSTYRQIKIGSIQTKTPLNCMIFDLSPVNISRFKTFLEDTDFMNKLIDGFRQFAPEQLQMNSQGIPADTMIPLMMAVRPFNSSSLTVATDGFSDLVGRVHPRNVLDFFSLDSAGVKAYPINMSSQNLYTVLPIIQ